jgi:hypothetical protein
MRLASNRSFSFATYGRIEMIRWCTGGSWSRYRCTPNGLTHSKENQLMKSQRGVSRSIAAAGFGLACGLALLNGTLAQAAPGRSASIISGSCASPGAVAASLANVGSAAPGSSTPGAAGLSPASAAVIPVQTSVTMVPMKLAELVDGSHAVTVAGSGAQAAGPAACGNLGSQTGGGDVVVGLAGSNGSNDSGIAWLHPSGDQTQITVFLAENPAGSGGRGGESEGDAG